MEGGGQVDAVYTDLKAAFDRIDHGLLLAKLNHLGVNESIVRWFESYLTGRSLTVRLGDFESALFCNGSGVPQGSNIGPLCFSVFYNDVGLVLPAGCRMLYADDLKIFLEIKCSDDCLNLQSLIDSFAKWCAANMLEVSVSKCNVISFTRKKHPLHWPYTINDVPLERVSVVKDLGVLLDAEMTFEEHYLSVVSKANRSLGFMLRITKEFHDFSCLRILYFALVRSHLESAAIVWCPFNNTWIQRIEGVQRRFTRYLMRLKPWPLPLAAGEELTYEQRCDWLNLDSLISRRKYLRAAFIGKLLLGSIDAPNILANININATPRLLRHRDFLRLNFQRTVYGQNEPIRAIGEIFNDVYYVFDFN